VPNRRDDIVMIEITLDGRTQAVKLAIYKTIAGEGKAQSVKTE
jgi:hypothetical protein